MEYRVWSIGNAKLRVVGGGQKRGLEDTRTGGREKRDDVQGCFWPMLIVGVILFVFFRNRRR